MSATLRQVDTPTQAYHVKSANEFIQAPPLRWLVRGVLPEKGLACIYGESGSGKSFLALDLCAAIAAGTSWFGRRVNAAPVVYVALEGEHGLVQRIKALQAHQHRNLPKDLRFVTEPLDIRKPQNLASLAHAVKASSGTGGLLVIDTLNRAAGGADENASKDMGEIIAAAKSLQSQLGGLVLLVHHCGKNTGNGMRGHSSLHAAMDAVVEVARSGESRKWRINKTKDDGDGDAFPFKLQVVEVGKDDYGERITSCVVVATDDGQEKPKRKLLPKSSNQIVIWDGLEQMLREAEPTVTPENSPKSLPAGRTLLLVDDVVAKLSGKLPCEAKRRPERTRNALTALHGKKLIVIEDGYVWLA